MQVEIHAKTWTFCCSFSSVASFPDFAVREQERKAQYVIMLYLFYLFFVLLFWIISQIYNFFKPTSTKFFQSLRFSLILKIIPPFRIPLTFYIKVIHKQCINVGQWLIKLIHFNFDTKQFSSRIISVMQGEHDKGYKVWGYINHLHFPNNYTGWL